MHCGERIQKLRIAKHLSVKGLAKEAGIEEAILESWEDGTSLPDPGKLLVLAAILGTSAEYLDKGVETKRENRHESKSKSGMGLFVAAMILYFAGYSIGEFTDAVTIGGTPLFYYGTSPVALALLIGAVLLVVLGVVRGFIHRKR